jgi:transcriptional regulator with XRE-family HTH domain
MAVKPYSLMPPIVITEGIVPYREIGERIVALREAAGKAQGETAREAGYSQALQSRLESGERSLGLGSVAIGLARVLGPYIFGLVDHEEELHLRQARFRFRLAEAIHLEVRLRRDVYAGGWGEITVEAANRARIQHQLALDWDSLLTPAIIVEHMPDLAADLNPEERAEIERAVADRRDIEKARQATLRAMTTDT